MVMARKVSMVVMSSVGMLLAVGCGGRHDSIPPSARLVAEDRGSIDFVAPGDGEVFVEDDSANKLLYRGRMEQGERLHLDPLQDRLAIDGRTVRDQKIRDLNNVRVYFEQEPRADVAGSRTIVVPTEPAQPERSRDSEIIVQPRERRDEDTIRVKSGANGDSKVTVEPGEDGSKVTIEPR